MQKDPVYLKNGDDDMLIINGRILTMAGADYEHGYLYCQGKIIKEVGDMKEFPGSIREKCQKEQDQVLDVQGRGKMGNHWRRLQ